MTHPMICDHFDTLEAFYADNPARRDSGESDYGVHWRGPDGRDWPRWRVSYIQATGEVYGHELGGAGRVEILGVVEPDPIDEKAPWGRQIYYRTLDALLDGWADGGGRDLQWVRDRLPRTPFQSSQTVDYRGHACLEAT